MKTTITIIKCDLCQKEISASDNTCIAVRHGLQGCPQIEREFCYKCAVEIIESALNQGLLVRRGFGL